MGTFQMASGIVLRALAAKSMPTRQMRLGSFIRDNLTIRNAPVPVISASHCWRGFAGVETKNDLTGDGAAVSAMDKKEEDDSNKGNSGEIVKESHSYFKTMISEATKTSDKPMDERMTAVACKTTEHVSLHPLSREELEIYAQLKPTSLKPVLKERSVSLAAYVNDSVTLTNLVQLGVDLSKVERNTDIANKLLTLDFEKDVKPYLLFLHDVGVPDTELGSCLTKNPRLFTEHMDDLQVRINYLRSKKFSIEAIAKIVTKAPGILSQSTKVTDAQLGYIQREFSLQGEEVRSIVVRLPKLTTWPRTLIKDAKFHLKEQMGFSDMELKQMALATPKLLVAGKHALLKRFAYIHNVIGLSHEKIAQWPSVLRTRTDILKQRHAFLSELGRAQYDVTKEHYVSLKALVSGRDEEFCRHVAKVPVRCFNDFLKSL